jgi:hypothetical protein
MTRCAPGDLSNCVCLVTKMGKIAKPKLKLTREIAGLADEINTILDTNQESRYFEAIAVIHSFLEDMLRWLIFTKIIWTRSGEDKSLMAPGEVEELRGYCNRLNFYSLLHMGLAVELLDFASFKTLDKIRSERNELVHQYWAYTHKGDRQVFRQKLEELAAAASDLVNRFNLLTEEIGEIDDAFLEVSPGRAFITL